jgi:hypothetical protein
MTGIDAPESFTEALRAVAAWLDTGDKAIKVLLHAKGLPDDIVGDEVQRDLRAMADRLDKTLIVRPTLNEMWKEVVDARLHAD